MNAQIVKPECLISNDDFSHKAEVLSAIANGASIRGDERTILAIDHIGTFTIRLRIAEDQSIEKPDQEQAARSAEEIRALLANLSKNPNAETRAWFINTQTGVRYVLIEDSELHVPLGCFRKQVITTDGGDSQA